MWNPRSREGAIRRAVDKYATMNGVIAKGMGLDLWTIPLF
jgi:hypothetical protein